MAIPQVKLNRGIHVMHLFYKIDRARWAALDAFESTEARAKLDALCAANSASSHPRLLTYTNVSGKADLVFFLAAAELGQISRMHREVEAAFPAGTLERAYQYLSVTELPEYVTTENDMRETLAKENLAAGSEAFEKRFQEMKERDRKSVV